MVVRGQVLDEDEAGDAGSYFLRGGGGEVTQPGPRLPFSGALFIPKRTAWMMPTITPNKPKALPKIATINIFTNISGLARPRQARK